MQSFFQRKNRLHYVDVWGELTAESEVMQLELDELKSDIGKRVLWPT